MLTVHKILIDNDSAQLRTSNFVIQQKALNEHLLQCIIQNDAKLSYELRTVELRLFGTDSKFISYKTFFLDEQIIKPNDDLAVEFYLEDIEKIGHAALKIRAVRWFNSEKILTFAIALLCIFLLGSRIVA